MRKEIHRIILCAVAVCCFWCGAMVGGGEMPSREVLVSGFRQAVQETIDPANAREYLEKIAPLIADNLAQTKKYFASFGK